MSEHAELSALAAALRHGARRRAFLGATRTRFPDVEAEPAPAAAARPDAPVRAPDPAPAPERPADPGTEENRRRAAACADLESLREVVAGCTACPLCETRKQTVFADGTERARVMFVGEAPGHHEDVQGVPFVGRAGALLTDIVTKGMRLAREDVYIANVLKCRPPENRDPEPREKDLCTPYLDRQIELVRPEVVITLGLHASRHLLRSSESMGRLRGRVHRRGELKIVATYHPAYLLRSPERKRDCWQDIQLAMAELGLSPRA